MGADMGTRISDSSMYAHLWRTPELEAIFEERARLQSWLDIITALAKAQARLGVIPPAAAAEIAERSRVDLLDLEHVAEQTRSSGHSALGLIRGLERVISEPSARYVYFGATVQDISDTWFGLVMRDVSDIVARDVAEIETTLVNMAERHRDTVMVGRTHAQPGAPTTFGLKVASWADEFFRHAERLRQGRPRWAVGQLAGAVGALAFYGPVGPELRSMFCAELGLGDPRISWTTSRDRVAEFAQVLAMVCASLARIGDEILQLQRPEIGELREHVGMESVGSITMPHKYNPEVAEHLDTLARLARASAGALLESMVSQHERDGRTWKVEWVALPEVCLLTGTALHYALSLLENLEVDAKAMRANLTSHGGLHGSEQVLAELSLRLGRYQAQRIMHEVLRENGVVAAKLPEVLAERGVAEAEEVRSWMDRTAVDVASVMVDDVVRRARAFGET
jgi:adenylosuccinate lyase